MSKYFQNTVSRVRSFLALALTLLLAAATTMPAWSSDAEEAGQRLKEAVESATGQTTIYLDEYVEEPELGGYIEIPDTIVVSADVELAVSDGVVYDGELYQDPYITVHIYGDARAFRVTGGGSLTVRGLVAIQGGGVQVDVCGGLSILESAKITDVGDAERGGAIENYGDTLLDGAVLTYVYGPVDRGGFVYNGETGKLTVRGDTHFYSGRARLGGCLYNDGDLYLESGILERSEAEESGGAVLNNSVMQMSGGALIGALAQDGGGIYNNGRLELSGGALGGIGAPSYNTIVQAGGATSPYESILSASGQGGGIYNNGSLRMTGATIAFCRADEAGGGIANHGSFTMSGGRIGKDFSHRGDEWYDTDYDRERFKEQLADGRLLFEISAPIGGAVYNARRMSLGGGVIEAAQAERGGGIYNTNELEMSAGSISHHSSEEAGAGVYLDVCATFIQTGGVIGRERDVYTVENNGEPDEYVADDFSNRSREGAGVYVGHLATYNMTGGSVSHNYGSEGAGIFVAGSATVEIDGGSVFENTALEGGGIFTENYRAVTVSDASALRDNRAEGLYELTDPDLQVLHDQQVKIPHYRFSKGMKYSYNNYDINHRDGEPLDPYHLVVFDPGDGTLYGTSAPHVRAVRPGTAVERPTPDPSHPRGYGFQRWVDRDSGLPWDFDSGVERDLYLIAGWARPGTAEAKNVVVSFDPDGGTVYGSEKPHVLSLTPGGTVGKIEAPVHPQGHAFLGWLHRKNDDPFSFDLPVQEDTYLYAAWDSETTSPETREVRVHFDPGGGLLYGSGEPYIQTVAAGGTATRPADPEHPGGHVFVCWDDSESETEWSFATAVEQDLFLLARWREPEPEGREFSLSLAAGRHTVEVLDRRKPQASPPALEELLPHFGPDLREKGSGAQVPAAYRSNDYGAVSFRELGVYSFLLEAVWTADGSEWTRKTPAVIEVVDTTPPTITTALATVTYDRYDAPGAMEELLRDVVPRTEDNYDETVPFSAEMEGMAWADVDWTAEGEYTLLLDAVDTSGNRAEQCAVTVIVAARKEAADRGETVTRLWDHGQSEPHMYAQNEDGTWITANPSTGAPGKRGAALLGLLASAIALALAYKKREWERTMPAENDNPEETGNGE